MSDKKENHSPEKKPNIFVRLGRRLARVLREMRSELKKVVWPTPKQLVNNSIVVVVMVIIVGSFIAAFDFGASNTIRFIISNISFGIPA